MSTFDTSNLENTSGGAPDFSQGLNVGGTDILTLVTPTEYHTGASEPSSPANGAVWYDGTDVLQYVNGGWYTLSVTAPLLYLGNTAVLVSAGNGNDASWPGDNYQTFNIATLGNASSFGSNSSTSDRHQAGSASNKSIAVFFGGSITTRTAPNSYSTAGTNEINYFTFATLGAAVDFGDVLATASEAPGMSDGTYGVFGPMDGFATYQIQYITFATPGNAVDFGNPSSSRRRAGACSNGSRGVMAGGNFFSYTNVIDYITIATPGNSTDFGDTLSVVSYLSGCSDATRGLFGGGNTSSGGTGLNTIQYVTIATPSNSTDFGDLTVGSYYNAAAANDTRATFMGGTGGTNVINYVTIATTGNATDFGDLVTTTNYKGSACSGG